jgi:hypothetical protein
VLLDRDATVAKVLMPTGGERLVWGTGDGSTLDIIDTGFGRLGGLICWENYMPLARAALYARGVDIYVAPTWDNSDVWVPTLRHILGAILAIWLAVTAAGGIFATLKTFLIIGLIAMAVVIVVWLVARRPRRD